MTYYFFFLSLLGTKSIPLPPKGLHLMILFIESQRPLHAPNLSIDTRAYSEQVGMYLQLEWACNGVPWYKFMSFIKIIDIESPYMGIIQSLCSKIHIF